MLTHSWPLRCRLESTASIEGPRASSPHPTTYKIVSFPRYLAGVPFTRGPGHPLGHDFPSPVYDDPRVMSPQPEDDRDR